MMKPTKKLIFALLDEKNWFQLSTLVRTGTLDPNWEATDAFERFSLLQSVISREGTQMAIQLIKAGANVNYREGGWTPLMLASKLRLHGVTDALISAGADVNAKSSKNPETGGGGDTALIAAAENADLWAVRRLIQGGADVNAANTLNENALFWAGRGARDDEVNADLSVAKELLKAGTRWRGNELQVPVLRRDIRMVKFFIQAGADVNGKVAFVRKDKRFPDVKKGDTPLIAAVRPTHREVAFWAGGSMIRAFHKNFKKAFNLKPVTSFASLNRRRVSIIKFLLEKGANPSVRNAQGENALEIAVRNANGEKISGMSLQASTVLKWLKQHSPKRQQAGVKPYIFD